ncbi:PLP-dependent aminotransferase family protein [Dickeya sp. CFBP 2040]|uniref:PLP-dependent aminotransferase family protein n=1 Tax=Dickeya poaceiphila TaxID=568768 RepID=A0A5B8IDD7_9GAMM|nr:MULTISPECIES: PLP-dependent aminotransferase family protein [Dickeya]NKI73688.1 PLP-dependent aminotransferase family protein [Dickeya sp. CFBP 2040]QDX31478.1 PLP-dependent aminotransferase family protein [Dickeya poaceiphila]
MDFLTRPFSPAPSTPLNQQLYQRIRDAIASGQLRPGERVPSVRSLASELNLARGTVEAAYQRLTSEGYLLPRGPAGTIVSPGLANLTPSHAPVAPASSRPPPEPDSPATLPFQLGLPALDAFPRTTWNRLVGQRLRTLAGNALAYPDPQGYLPLRRAIAAYLGVSRGIACSEQQIFITAGYHCSLDLICRTLFKPDDLGWYEDPGYPLARRFLLHAGMQLAPVSVDEDGLDVAAGEQYAGHARFAVVTPTHQSPLGVALSLPRRLALLAWAARREAWVIEDDYDSEFRYHGRPLPALKSLDNDERVIYTGTFSKVFFPGLRLAYLVVPQAQIPVFQQTAQILHSNGFILAQATTADFMEQGHFARHIRKMRTLYAERRRYLQEAITALAGNRVNLHASAGGMHLLARLALEGQHDRDIAAQAITAGLSVQALSQWRQRANSAGGLLLGFTNLVSAEQAHQLTQRLCALPSFQRLPTIRQQPD